jgi:ABC-type lipoprotein export system ATPase subunit
LILADEATGNLDPANKNRILDLLFKSVEDNDATLVAVTHDHELLPRFDRVIDFQEFQLGAKSKETGAKMSPPPTPDPQPPTPKSQASP